MTTADRRSRLVAALGDRGLDGIFVTTLVNVRYLTGFTGSNGACLVGPELWLFFTDFRYTERAAEEVGPEWERPAAERELLLDTLARTRWNVTAAATRLGMPRRTIVHRMAKLGLKRPAR